MGDDHVTLSIRSLAIPTVFPLMLRIPQWCTHASLTLSAKPYIMPGVNANGFVTLNRQWSAGDELALQLPLAIRATKRKTFMNGKHAPMSRTTPWTGASVTPGLPFCKVEVGPLAFALPLEKTPGGPANYAIDCNASTMVLSMRAMPSWFDWPLESPIVVQVQAQVIEWSDVWVMPSSPFVRNSTATQVELSLIPYGAAKGF